jgi:hypothetical protein
MFAFRLSPSLMSLWLELTADATDDQLHLQMIRSTRFTSAVRFCTDCYTWMLHKRMRLIVHGKFYTYSGGQMLLRAADVRARLRRGTGVQSPLQNNSGYHNAWSVI